MRRHDGAGDEFPRSVLREAEAYLAAQDLGGGLSVPMKLKQKSVACPYVLLASEEEDDVFQ